jgi:hypothetical protein
MLDAEWVRGPFGQYAAEGRTWLSHVVAGFLETSGYWDDALALHGVAGLP